MQTLHKKHLLSFQKLLTWHFDQDSLVNFTRIETLHESDILIGLDSADISSEMSPSCPNIFVYQPQLHFHLRNKTVMQVKVTIAETKLTHSPQLDFKGKSQLLSRQTN